MRSVEEHLAVVLAGAGPLPPQHVPLLDALDLVLAEDVVADVALPGFDNSSMDGFAVLAADVVPATDAAPVVLDVVGDHPAGTAGRAVVRPGQAVRVMTGAPLPRTGDDAERGRADGQADGQADGGDDLAVVQVEWTDAHGAGWSGAPDGGGRVAVHRAVAAGRNIRRAGEDVAVGETVLRSGERLSPRHVGLLASLGRGEVLVHPRPRVLVLSTGSEVVEPGEPLAPGQLYDSNSTALVAACRDLGAHARRVRAVEDDPARFLQVLHAELADTDLVLTTGGVSAGAYEVVKEGLARLGTVEFAAVAMQPGKPQGAGTLTDPGSGRQVRVLTLPGNPVSAVVSFEVFVRPVLRTMLGEHEVSRPTVRAVVERGWRSPAGRRQFHRVQLTRAADGGARVSTIGGPGSHLVADLVTANALAVVPEEMTDVEPGATLTCMLLERGRR